MATKSRRLARFVASVGDDPVFVGVDVHKHTYSVALFCAADGQIETWNCPADEAGLEEQLKGLGCRIEHVVYETGPTGFSLCRALRDAGFNASVVAGSRIPRGAAASAKSDRIDATKLAIYFARGLLRSVAVPSAEEEGYRALVRRRKRVAEALAKLKQKIKGFLLATGVAEPPSCERWTLRVADDLAALPLGPGHDSTMASLIREYRFLQKEHRTLEREVMRATRRLYPEQYARLTKVGGVGEVVATTFLAEIFAPKRFDRAEEVSSYLGLAPMVRRSGEGPVRARLRSVGQDRLRSVLIEGAWSWRRHDKEAAALYNRHLAKSGVSQKAICAVARKLAIKLWRLAVETSPTSMEGAAAAPRSA